MTLWLRDWLEGRLRAVLPKPRTCKSQKA